MNITSAATAAATAKDQKKFSCTEKCPIMSRTPRCEYGASICPSLALASLFACIGVPMIFLEERRQRVAYFVASSVVCLLLAIISHQVNVVRPIKRLEETSAECLRILMQYCASLSHMQHPPSELKVLQISSASSGQALTISPPASPTDIRLHPRPPQPGSDGAYALDMGGDAHEVDEVGAPLANTVTHRPIHNQLAKNTTSTTIMAVRQAQSQSTAKVGEVASEELVNAQSALHTLAEHIHVSSQSGLYYVLQGQCKDIVLALITLLRVVNSAAAETTELKTS
ncbi:transmembrane protein, putative [Bodo saltans]|uniref:Transmembrane protein, putative n=1 Tax=Bodo saltans TaxID=75058 RepID=A0A0S4IK32_BODSA|nr:transmembrane protein, putative [Bodo saltans]|eukprot:CUE60054.1 transmembrane protein, putative [Bodo saltans]